MPEQRGFAHPAAAVDHNKLTGARVRSGQDVSEEGQFRSTIDKHIVLTQKHQHD
jgi:hypothetical protein